MTVVGLEGLPAPISCYLKRLSETSREEFLATLTDPVFLVEPYIAPDDTGFQTLMGIKGKANEHGVAVIAKREGANAFSDMITIGRAGNNDIVIRYRGISKFHAYVPTNSDPQEIVDANSTNGSFVENDELEANVGVELKPGWRVRLSDLHLVYYTPEKFCDYLEPRLA